MAGFSNFIISEILVLAFVDLRSLSYPFVQIQNILPPTRISTTLVTPLHLHRTLMTYPRISSR